MNKVQVSIHVDENNHVEKVFEVTDVIGLMTFLASFWPQTLTQVQLKGKATIEVIAVD